jgi:hypothetical protein
MDPEAWGLGELGESRVMAFGWSSRMNHGVLRQRVIPFRPGV